VSVRLLGAAIVLAAVALAACGGRPHLPSAPPVPVGREFTLAMGQSVLVDGSGLRVTFAGVDEDSRCPSGVQCVWEGDAAVSLVAASADVPRASYELHTSLRFAREAAHGRYRIVLLRLDPTPVAGRPVPPGDYRATVVVARP
jgi:hypothetical protein